MARAAPKSTKTTKKPKKATKFVKHTASKRSYNFRGRVDDIAYGLIHDWWHHDPTCNNMGEMVRRTKLNPATIKYTLSQPVRPSRRDAPQAPAGLHRNQGRHQEAPRHR
jgi:hypothetical protein